MSNAWVKQIFWNSCENFASPWHTCNYNWWSKILRSTALPSFLQQNSDPFSIPASLAASSLRRYKRERHQPPTIVLALSLETLLRRCSTTQPTAKQLGSTVSHHQPPRQTTKQHPHQRDIKHQHQLRAERKPSFCTASAQVIHSQRWLTAPYRKTPQKRAGLIPDGKNRVPIN